MEEIVRNFPFLVHSGENQKPPSSEILGLTTLFLFSILPFLFYHTRHLNI